MQDGDDIGRAAPSLPGADGHGFWYDEGEFRTEEAEPAATLKQGSGGFYRNPVGADGEHVPVDYVGDGTRAIK